MNKSILCKPLWSIIFLYSTSSINFYLSHNPPKRTLNCNKDHFHRYAYNVMLIFSAFLTLCLYSANDVTSKWYYTSVISFIFHGLITLDSCTVHYVKVLLYTLIFCWKKCMANIFLSSFIIFIVSWNILQFMAKLIQYCTRKIIPFL